MCASKYSSLGIGIFFFLTWIFSFSPAGAVLGQNYPEKAITIYCGYEAGATRDWTPRGLAAVAKLLEVCRGRGKQGGGGAAVAAGLVAGEKQTVRPSSHLHRALTVRPHLFKIYFKPGATHAPCPVQPLHRRGSACSTKSPLKTIDDFIAFRRGESRPVLRLLGRFYAAAWR